MEFVDLYRAKPDAIPWQVAQMSSRSSFVEHDSDGGKEQLRKLG